MFKIDNLQRNNTLLTIDNEKINHYTSQIALIKLNTQKIVTLEENIKQKDSSILQLTYKIQRENTIHQEKIALLEKEIIVLKEINEKNSIFHHLNEITFQYPKTDSFTQTEITELGFWDTQNGWILPISKTALARSRWRKAKSYASCPSCRGQGKYMAQVAMLLKQCVNGGDPSNSSLLMLLGEETRILIDRSGNSSSSNGGALVTKLPVRWRLPDELAFFLNNLPSTVQGVKPKSLLWLLHHIEMIFNYKFLSNEEDGLLGYTTQPLIEFIIENFLRNCESRLLAEFELFTLLLTLKEYAFSHPVVTFFARFLSVIDDFGNLDEEKLVEIVEKVQGKLKKSFNVNDKQVDNAKKPVKRSSINVSITSSSVVDSSFQNTSSFYYSLSKDILKITLIARYCCLSEPYHGVYANAITDIRKGMKQHCYSYRDEQQQAEKCFENENSTSWLSLSTSKKVIDYETKYQKHSQAFWNKSHEVFTKQASSLDCLPSHVFYDMPSFSSSTAEKFLPYLPLDRVIRVLQPFLSNLSPEEVIAIYRSIENETKCLFSDGSISVPDGLRTFIRSTMRLFVYAFSENGEDISSWEEIKERYHHPSDEITFNLLQEMSIEVSSFNDNKSSEKQKVYFQQPHQRKPKSEKQLLQSLEQKSDVQSKKKQQWLASSINENVDRLSLKNGGDIGASNASAMAKKELIVIHEDCYKYLLVTNLNHFLLILTELMHRQLLSIEKKLHEIFEKGDINHDNVLSFDEFKAIILHVKPSLHDRTIMKMFREALLSSPDNKDCIGPDSFLAICKEYHLFEIVSVFCSCSGIGCSLISLLGLYFLFCRDLKLLSPFHRLISKM
jgi:hypothetical protein